MKRVRFSYSYREDAIIREAKLDPLVKFRVWLLDGDKVGGHFYAFFTETRFLLLFRHS